MTDLFDGLQYSQGLPKRVRERIQCDALDEDGNRCDLPAVFEAPYYGDENCEKAPWVVARLCDFHGDVAAKKWEDNLPYRLWKDAKKKGVLWPGKGK